jgi:hypothetical protein
MILDQLNNHPEEITGSLHFSEKPEEKDTNDEEEHTEDDINEGSLYHLEIVAEDEDEFLNDAHQHSDDQVSEDKSLEDNGNPVDENG